MSSSRSLLIPLLAIIVFSTPLEAASTVGREFNIERYPDSIMGRQGAGPVVLRYQIDVLRYRVVAHDGELHAKSLDRLARDWSRR